MTDRAATDEAPAGQRDDWDGDRRSIGGLLAVALRALTNDHHRRLDAAGYPDIRPGSGNVFEHIGPEGSTVAAMAERAGITPQAVVQLVDYLESRGYVERIPAPMDRRAKIVRLTERGQAANRVARTNLLAIEADWERLIGEEHFRHLRSSLRSLVAALDAKPEPGDR